MADKKDETDKILEEMTKRIRAIYEQANEESTQRLVDFWDNFLEEDKKMQEQLEAGIITSDVFEEWRRTQFIQSAQYEAVQTAIANDLVNADVIASGVVNQNLPDVYAYNMNDAQFEVCRKIGQDFDPAFALYDRYTVQKLLNDGEYLYPVAAVDLPLDQQYTRKHITNSITQGILQGESIEKIANRMTGVTQMSYNSAVRTARTLTTSAQNAGRVDCYKNAQTFMSKAGMELQKEWMAALDSRTRHSHRVLDGVRVGLDEKFPNGCRYPADPQGPASEIYNCRCTLVAAIKGYDYKDERLSRLDMTYEEWKVEHEKESYSNVVHGVDITKTFVRNPEYEYEIQDILHAQGFDGLPLVVSEEEFNKYVEESNFIAVRGYTAPDAETLKAYEDSLYKGEWYVDCSNGGSIYGKGMYSAYTNGKEPTDQMQTIARWYGGDDRDTGKVETFTLHSDARTITYDEIYKIKKDFENEWRNGGGKDDFINRVAESTADQLGLTGNERIYMRERYFELDTGNNDVVEWYKSLDEFEQDALDSKIEQTAVAAYQAAYNTRFDTSEIAALLGYDAVLVEHENYAVVLNRTACIFKEPEK